MLKKKSMIASIIVFAFIVSSSSLFPVENLFLTFNSPEEVFHYCCVGKIEYVVERKESCLILYQRKDGVYSNRIFKKDESGYTIISFLSLKELKTDSPSLSVIFPKGTKDYYLVGVELVVGDSVEVLDEQGNNLRFICADVPNSQYAEIIIASPISYQCNNVITINGTPSFLRPQ